MANDDTRPAEACPLCQSTETQVGKRGRSFQLMECRSCGVYWGRPLFETADDRTPRRRPDRENM